MRFNPFVTHGLALLLVGAANAGTLREDFEKTYSLAKGGKVVLSNTNGTVSVESWDKEEVRIQAEKIVRADGRRRAEEIMEEIRIEITQREGVLEIETEIPRYRNGFWDSVFGDDISIAVNYRLLVPAEINLDVGTVNGAVAVTRITGRIQLSSTNGRIKVFESKGTIATKTTNGGIEAELLGFNAEEDMSFHTINGSITVYFPENFRGEIEARTTNGSIKTDFPIEVQGEISKRRLRGTINGGGGRVDFHTTNGSIKILAR